MAEKKTAADALARAAKDKDFAVKLINNPAQFRDEYELTDEQMKNISGAGQSALKGGGQNNQLYDGSGGGTGGSPKVDTTSPA
jgi:hypothetical protein